MADNELWRKTDLGERVFKIFDDLQIARLEAYVERIGFRDNETRGELADLIRQWAFRWLHEIDGTKRRQRPDGKGRRDADRAEVASSTYWKKVVKDINTLRQSLEGLPPGTKRFLIEHLAWDPSKPLKQIVATWPDGRNPLAQLIHQLDRLQVATPPVRKRGGKPKPYSAAVRDLGRVWIYLTGSQPGISYSEASRGYEGAFYDFANDAVLALWPKVRSIDGILKRLPKSYGRE